MPFVLNSRLEAGSFHLATLSGCQVRLKNNALFPWFLIIPEVSSELEDLHQLSEKEYHLVTQLIRDVSTFVSQLFPSTKLNVGCIGNQVRQMHIHIVARSEDDPAWPGTVWSVSKSCKEAYAENRIAEIKGAFRQAFELD